MPDRDVRTVRDLIFYQYAKIIKTVFDCHECAGTLGATDLDGDGVMTVADIDALVARHAGRGPRP